MKKEKGITLIALIMYIIMFSVTIALLAYLSSYIFGNLDNIDSNSISSEEFNKFNVNFVKDVKESRKVNIETKDEETVISFESGTNYTYKPSEKAIYKDKEKIAVNIVSFTAKQGIENNKTVIEVSIATGKDVDNPNYSKTIKYVLRYW